MCGCGGGRNGYYKGRNNRVSATAQRVARKAAQNGGKKVAALDANNSVAAQNVVRAQNTRTGLNKNSEEKQRVTKLRKAAIKRALGH